MEFTQGLIMTVMDLQIISGKVTNLEASLTEGIDSDLVLQVLGGAVEELTTRIDRDSDRLTVESQKIVDLSASYENLADSVSANGNAFNELKTRVDADSDKLSVVSSDITNLTASITDPTTGLSANASAVSALTATVDDLGNCLCCICFGPRRQRSYRWYQIREYWRFFRVYC